MDGNLRGVWEETKGGIIKAVNDVIDNQPLILNSSVELSHKTISEIGGRIIEEYITKFVKHSKFASFFEVQLLASRGVGDFKVLSKDKEFFVDVKCQHVSIRDRTFEFYQKHGIEKNRPGESHPNLISAQKATEFYSDENLKNKDIAFLLIKYDPEIDNRTVHFNLKTISSNQVMLLRDISGKNLTFGSLGRGQIQLSRINAIEETPRTKIEFLDFIEALRNRPRKQRGTSRKDF